MDTRLLILGVAALLLVVAVVFFVASLVSAARRSRGVGPSVEGPLPQAPEVVPPDEMQEALRAPVRYGSWVPQDQAENQADLQVVPKEVEPGTGVGGEAARAEVPASEVVHPRAGGSGESLPVPEAARAEGPVPAAAVPVAAATEEHAAVTEERAPEPAPALPAEPVPAESVPAPPPEEAVTEAGGETEAGAWTAGATADLDALVSALAEESGRGEAQAAQAAPEEVVSPEEPSVTPPAAETTDGSETLSWESATLPASVSPVRPASVEARRSTPPTVAPTPLAVAPPPPVSPAATEPAAASLPVGQPMPVAPAPAWELGLTPPEAVVEEAPPPPPMPPQPAALEHPPIQSEAALREARSLEPEGQPARVEVPAHQPAVLMPEPAPVEIEPAAAVASLEPAEPSLPMSEVPPAATAAVPEPSPLAPPEPTLEEGPSSERAVPPPVGEEAPAAPVVAPPAAEQAGAPPVTGYVPTASIMEAAALEHGRAPAPSPPRPAATARPVPEQPAESVTTAAETIEPPRPPRPAAVAGVVPSAERAAGAREYRMVAPVELLFDDGAGRVGIRPGTATFLKFQRLAAVLLTDLRKYKPRS